jgi:hypothetical protein
MSDVPKKGSRAWIRWTIRAVLLGIVVLVAGGLWCVYLGVSESLHAENGLHATQYTFEAVEDFLKKHDGEWPRSWKQLEQSSPQMSDVYESVGGPDKVEEFVAVDFDADPDRLAKQTQEEFQAIKPVGSFYGSYKFRIPSLLESLRQTRHRPESAMARGKTTHPRCR